MTIIDNWGDDLARAELSGETALFTDADHTLFEPGTTDLYPDAQTFLEADLVSTIALVSANPDRDLAEARGQIIGADVVQVPERKKWIKAGLFNAAFRGLQEQERSVDRALVLGDRWFMDVVVGKSVLAMHGVDVQGYMVRRSSEAPTVFDRLVLNHIEYAGGVIVKKAGIDELVRPRR